MRVTVDDIDGGCRDRGGTVTKAHVEPVGELFGNGLHPLTRDAGGAPDEGFEHHVQKAPRRSELGLQEDPGQKGSQHPLDQYAIRAGAAQCLIAGDIGIAV